MFVLGRSSLPAFLNEAHVLPAKQREDLLAPLRAEMPAAVAAEISLSKSTAATSTYK